MCVLHIPTSTHQHTNSDIWYWICLLLFFLFYSPFTNGFASSFVLILPSCPLPSLFSLPFAPLLLSRLSLFLPCLASTPFNRGLSFFASHPTHPTLIFPPSLSLPSLSLLHHNLFLILHPIILSLIHNPILILINSKPPTYSFLSPFPILITHLFSLSLSLPHSLTLTL